MEEFENITRPTIQSKLRSLLGLLNYYRKFIPHLIISVAPSHV